MNEIFASLSGLHLRYDRHKYPSNDIFVAVCANGAKKLFYVFHPWDLFSCFLCCAVDQPNCSTSETTLQSKFLGLLCCGH